MRADQEIRAAAIQAAVILRGAAAPVPEDDDDFAELFELSDKLAKYIKNEDEDPPLPDFRRG